MTADKPCQRALILSGSGARGAYEAGVWKYLHEQGWKPALVCGTSVGAINACGVGMEMSGDELADLWHHIAPERVFRVPFFGPVTRRIRSRLTKKANPVAFLSNEPLRDDG